MPLFTNLLTALGWSLLDSVWQMAFLWMVYCLLTACIKRFSAAGKYNLGLVLIFIGTEWFIYSLIHLINEPGLPYMPGFIIVSPAANRWIPLLSLLYLLGLAFRFLQQFIRTTQSKMNRAVLTISPFLQSFTDRHARILGITKRVHVYLSDLAGTAETSGFIKPIILLPLSLVTRLTQQQLEAILIHELFHIRRNDYLINIFLYVFRNLFFFNPFARFFYSALVKERELACDDGVVEMNYPPDLYAEALFSLEKFRRVQTGFAIAADGNKPWLLMERIQRVLGRPVQQKKRFSPIIMFSLISAFTLFGLKQKPVTPPAVVRIAARPVTVFTRRYESGEMKITGVEKKITGKINIRRKTLPRIIVEQSNPVQVPEIAETVAAADGVSQALFADQNIVRNFSNEQAAGMNTDPVHVTPGAPYVPSASLMYEDLPDNLIRDDSIRDLIIQNGIKDLVVKTRLQTEAAINDLQKEMEIGKQQLKALEAKNRQRTRLYRKSMKPVLEEIKNSLKIKKQEIDQLQIRLRISDEEIIHI